MAIINNSYKFIFVHIPKTAGTSVTNVLSQMTNYCDLEIGGTEFGEKIQPAYSKRFGLKKHSTSVDIRKIVGDVSWNKYFKFSFVRNPFTRSLSTYNFLRNWTSPNESFTTRMRGFKTFDEFVLSGFWDETTGPDEIFRPQMYWLRENIRTQELNVNYVGRLETLEDDLLSVLNMIGAPYYMKEGLKIPELNKSQAEQKRIELSDNVIEAITSKYSLDFENFNYAQDPSTGLVK